MSASLDDPFQGDERADSGLDEAIGAHPPVHPMIASGVEASGNSGIASTKRLMLEPLNVHQVPAHPDLEGLQENPPTIEEFLRSLFVEADAEIERPRKSIGKFKDEIKDGEGNKFAVEVNKWKSEGEGSSHHGTWFGRSSEHVEGRPVVFDELQACLMKGHERKEAEYTPAIYDVNTVLEWDMEGEVRWKVQETFDVRTGSMKEIEMRITQMHHSMPGGILDDRVFTVLMISFVNTDPPEDVLAESINMQIPVDLFSFPPLVVSRSHVHRDPSSKKLSYRNARTDTSEQLSKSKQGKSVVEGRYVSVERVQKIEKKDDDNIDVIVTQWDMKTASDAGGKLPMAVQKLGVPGAISKDVPLALQFVVSRRGASGYRCSLTLSSNNRACLYSLVRSIPLCVHGVACCPSFARCVAMATSDAKQHKQQYPSLGAFLRDILEKDIPAAIVQSVKFNLPDDELSTPSLVALLAPLVPRGQLPPQTAHPPLTLAALHLWNLQQQYRSPISSSSPSLPPYPSTCPFSYPSIVPLYSRPPSSSLALPVLPSSSSLPRHPTLPSGSALSVDGLAKVPRKFLIQVYTELLIGLCKNLEFIEYPAAWEGNLSRTYERIKRRDKWYARLLDDGTIRFVKLSAGRYPSQRASSPSLMPATAEVRWLPVSSKFQRGVPSLDVDLSQASDKLIDCLVSQAFRHYTMPAAHRSQPSTSIHLTAKEHALYKACGIHAERISRKRFEACHVARPVSLPTAPIPHVSEDSLHHSDETRLQEKGTSVFTSTSNVPTPECSPLD
ncbi:unnamed protein product [Periconia digitata]|uniref:DUF3074 domain-containing protein n=1 Tax=Periconia digitata TaxID=1303443 RepID=A0A9W4UV88_9PLEO|nr:unnamed protein product [Periconia digitata]